MNLFEIFILLISSVLPVYIIANYIYQHDFDKEPSKLIIQLFFMGAGAIILTFAISIGMEKIMPFFRVDNVENLDIFELIPYVFIGVALVEEFSKWFFVYFFTYKHKEFNHAYDGIVYATCVSLGFALIENILYVLSGGLQVAFTRAISAVPGHACFGIMMGYYIAMAKITEKTSTKDSVTKNKVLSLLCPILLHGLYDFLIYGSQIYPIMVILYVVFVVLFFKYAPKKLYQLEHVYYNFETGNMDIPRVEQPQVVNPYMNNNVNPNVVVCRNCNQVAVGNFCQNCGFPLK